MSIIKSNSRKTIWSAIDAADATISNAQYVIFDASVTAAADDVTAIEGDITTLEADITTLQGDINDLEALNDIIASVATNNTAAVKANASMPATTKTIKVVDENGDLVGYAPLYANANLS